MTKLELEEIIKRQNRFHNRTNRVFAIIIIILGLIFMPVIIKKGVSPNVENVMLTWVGILSLPIIPILISVLVLYRIPRQYRVTEVLTNEKIDVKQKRFIETLANYKIKATESNNEIKVITCINRYFNGFDIFIYIDNEKYLFNVLSHDIYGAKGVFDLGLSNRITKRIKASLQQPV